jgi:hypothetical protein
MEGQNQVSQIGQGLVTAQSLTIFPHVHSEKVAGRCPIHKGA